MLDRDRRGSILCDPWFVPAFFGSWFVVPPQRPARPTTCASGSSTPTSSTSPTSTATTTTSPGCASTCAATSRSCCPASRPASSSARSPRSASPSSSAPSTPKRLEIAPGLTVAIHIEIVDHRRPGRRLGAGRDLRRHVDPRQPERLPHHRPRPAPRPRPGRPALAAVLGRDLVPDGLRDDPTATKRRCARRRSTPSSPGRCATSRRSTPATSCRAPGRRASSTPTCSALNMIDGDELSIFPDQTAFLTLLDEQAARAC